jgi:sugar phosphate isomerase/epimerase
MNVHRPETISIGAITDEFSPSLDTALEAMSDLSMSTAELRVVDGTNIVELSDAQVDEARRKMAARGMRVVAIATPLLKCEVPGGPPVDSRFQQDLFGAAYGYADQPRIAERAMRIAERLGTRIVRVFSFWRTIRPDECFDTIVAALRDLSDQAAARGLVIGLENEHACHVGTAAEAVRVLDALDHPALALVWDPANALVAGERPFPDGYAQLPRHRIVHVHAKDCRVRDHSPTWGPIGEMDVDWPGQLAALARDGYSGAIHLETHWKGPGGDKLEASRICGRNLQQMLDALGRQTG